MFAYYNKITGFVSGFSNEDIQLPRVEVSDINAVQANTKKGLIAKIENGQLIFVQDRAAFISSVRAKRKELLQEADAYENRLKDQALISGTPTEQYLLVSLAVYRQALRDIVEANEIVWPQKPW